MSVGVTSVPSHLESVIAILQGVGGPIIITLLTTFRELPLPSLYNSNQVIRIQQTADKQKDTIFMPTSFVPKLFYPRKCVNYDKSEFLTNSVKVPKDQNSDKKPFC